MTLMSMFYSTNCLKNHHDMLSMHKYCNIIIKVKRNKFSVFLKFLYNVNSLTRNNSTTHFYVGISISLAAVIRKNSVFCFQCLIFFEYLHHNSPCLGSAFLQRSKTSPC